MQQTLLRNYQQIAIDAAREFYTRGGKSLLLVLPCGAGKTTIFSYLTEQVVSRDKKVLVIAHRKELIDQASERLTNFGVHHGVIMGIDSRRDLSAAVQVASIDTLRNRPCWDNYFDLIIIDEAHRIRAKSYMEYINKSPKSLVLGVTATPFRLDGKGLGDVFQQLISTVNIKDLIKQGYLIRPRIFVPKHIDLTGVRKVGSDYNQGDLDKALHKPNLIGDIITEWFKHAKGKRTMVYATSVAHSNEIVEKFRAHGINAWHCDADTPKTRRKWLVKALKTGKIDLLSNCGLFTEGTDIPEIECVILARSTLSRSLYEQMAGRGLRTATGKESCVYLDHANLVEEHGSFLDAPEYTLDIDLPRRRKGSAPAATTIRICPVCSCVNELSAEVCMECNSTLYSGGRTFKTKDGELKEIELNLNDSAKPVPLKVVLSGATTEEDLRKIAQERGYKEGWIKHIMEARSRRKSSTATPN